MTQQFEILFSKAKKGRKQLWRKLEIPLKAQTRPLSLMVFNQELRVRKHIQTLLNPLHVDSSISAVYFSVNRYLTADESLVTGNET